MKRVLALAVLLLLALAAAACGGGTVTRSTDSLAQSAQASSGETRGVTGTMLRDGTEIPVYLAVSDTEIAFWDSPSGGDVLAVARYPEPMPGAAAALTDCDHQDLDGDGCLTLELRFRYGEREVHSSAASEEWGQVYKLIAKDTIEEQILDLQDKKAALMDALSGTTEAGILEMSKEELLELLKIG